MEVDLSRFRTLEPKYKERKNNNIKEQVFKRTSDSSLPKLHSCSAVGSGLLSPVSPCFSSAVPLLHLHFPHPPYPISTGISQLHDYALGFVVRHILDKQTNVCLSMIWDRLKRIPYLKNTKSFLCITAHACNHTIQ